MRIRPASSRSRRFGVLAACVALMSTLSGALAAADTQARLPFRDPRLPLSVRVDDLVNRLTLAEKISLLHQFQPAIPRLGIPEFKTGTEALHGLAWTTDRNNNGAVVTANDIIPARNSQDSDTAFAAATCAGDASARSSTTA